MPRLTRIVTAKRDAAKRATMAATIATAVATSTTDHRLVTQRGLWRQTVRGWIIWEGPSEYNGAPIVAIATYGKHSANRKVGKMSQLWIMAADVDPITAAYQTGADVAVCLYCPLRPSETGVCYVNKAHAPAGIYQAYVDGMYAYADASALALLRLYAMRLGAYGDVAALPLHVVVGLLGHTAARRWRTGYTHAWATRVDLAPWVMASVDTLADKVVANALGFATFRVGAATEEPLDDERLCVNVSHDIQCADCRLCGGSDSPNIFIPAHGNGGNALKHATARADGLLDLAHFATAA